MVSFHTLVSDAIVRFALYIKHKDLCVMCVAFTIHTSKHYDTPLKLLYYCTHNIRAKLNIALCTFTSIQDIAATQV